MKVLVTGATGRLGRSFIQHKPESMEIEVLLGPSDPQIPDLAWYRSDITESDRTFMAATCADPEVILHLAAMTDVDGCERDPDTALRINADGAEIIARAATKSGAQMIYVSTDYVFDGKEGPYAEDDHPNPISEYGRSKLAGEKAVKAVSPEALILRISVPFGNKLPGAAHNFVSWLFSELKQGNKLRIVDDQYTTPAWLDELSQIIWLCIEEKVTGILHYGTFDRLSRYEMTCAVASQIGADADELVTPIKTADLGLIAPRPLESGFVTGRVHDIMGRAPVTFTDALTRMMETLEQTG